MIVISVSKAYQNGSKRMRKKGPTRAQTKWKAYLKDDNGKFYTKWISLIQVPFYKSQKRYKRTLICQTCELPFIAYIKNDKEIVGCPRCD